MTSHFDEGSYDEEEEYYPISEREEEAPDPEYEYGTLMNPLIYLEVRFRNSSPSRFVNTTNNNSGNSGQGSPASQTFFPRVPRVNIMAGNDIKLSIFNGNGLEHLEKHWFLCEAIWTVQPVQDEAIKKEHIITTLRGHVLYWYMNFYVVSTGVAQKTLDQILAGLIDEFRNPKFESQCIT